MFPLLLLLTQGKAFTNNDFDKIGYHKCKGVDNNTEFTYYCLVDEQCYHGNTCRQYPEICRTPKYFILMWFLIFCIEFNICFILGWNQKTLNIVKVGTFALEQVSNIIGWAIIFFLVGVKYNIIYTAGIILLFITWVLLLWPKYILIRSTINKNPSDLKTSFNDLAQKFPSTDSIQTDPENFNVTYIKIGRRSDKEELTFIKNYFYKLSIDERILVYPFQKFENRREIYCVYEGSSIMLTMINSKFWVYLSLILGFSSIISFYDNSKDCPLIVIEIAKEGNLAPECKNGVKHTIPSYGKHDFDLVFSTFKYKRFN